MFSDGYNKDDLLYVWTNGAGHSIKMAPDLTLSQFDLIGMPHANETSGKTLGTQNGRIVIDVDSELPTTLVLTNLLCFHLSSISQLTS